MAGLSKQAIMPFHHRHDGFAVTTLFDGESLGRVVGATQTCYVIESGRWPLRQFRALPFERTIVREEDEEVVSLASADVVRSSPRLQSNAPVEEAGVLAHYDLGYGRRGRPRSGAR